ncbi:PREDICTED: cation/calcium exchanger 4-like [Ipomoea nil]|uniref:cation/calcium exchanger 4-like n=1 Tax=Ipomoea nil TaxID=35883 RepID=UPI000901D216|nr:PREDICTED: cation/calcium exchanger 4-like [Ipomoea nil]
MEALNSSYLKKKWKFRVVFQGICALAFIFLVFHQDSFQNPVSKKPFLVLSGLGRNGSDGEALRRRIAEKLVEGSDEDSEICSGIYEHEGYDTECEYLKANPECNSGGFFDYIKFFYCDCERYSGLRYLVLGVWLVALFYLLGNTAADYFCPCLESLSNLLRLPPTLAGVTLLPLGNGAPDVFASVAAFVGSDSGAVGLNGVLGGAVFVTTVVAGTVALCVADGGVRIDKRCFIRDVCFFLFAAVCLGLILVLGEVSVGVAIGFLGIYVVYAVCVAANELLRKHGGRLKLGLVSPLLPVLSYGSTEEESLCASFVQSGCDDEVPRVEKVKWDSSLTIYSNEGGKVALAPAPAPSPGEGLWGWDDERGSSFSCSKLLSLLEVPLMLPRRLTIPILDEQQWSKVYAVASAALSPLLLAFLWNTRDNVGSPGWEIVCFIGAIVGSTLGGLAFIYTRPDHPPQRFLFPWIFGGFFMSIVWFYILANELVALLVSFGVIFGINPSLLALTVLAWGNSLGDLMANVAMAMKNGDGVQIAMSGCYGGPMFNTLIGLGISLLLGAWSQRPGSYTIPKDTSLYYTLGFLVLALLFALVVLPRNEMRPNKVLGFGLMTLYLLFLSIRASIALGDGSLPTQANLN